MNNKTQMTIAKRIKTDQIVLLDQLKKTPIVQIGCEKTNIGRATYYRWRNQSVKFAKLADEALQEGNLLVNDMAESQLLSAVRDKNMTGIIFWLKHHHSAYADRIEIKGKLKHQYNLSSEQEALISKALSMVVGKVENGQ
jgi:hypothetical protein